MSVEPGFGGQKFIEETIDKIYKIREINKEQEYPIEEDSHGTYILNKSEGFILSKNHYLGTDPRKVKVNKNILVFGGSGTGKTASYIKPNILQKLGSYVITDPKGELYRETSGYLKANGYEVKVLNLVDTEYSNRYNPLSHIRDYSDVDIIAHTIVAGGEGDGGGKSADPFWDNTAKMLLKACIYYVISVLPEEERNLSSCLNIVRAGGSDESIFDVLKKQEEKEQIKVKEEPTRVEQVIKEAVFSNTDFNNIDMDVQYDVISLPSNGECYKNKTERVPVGYLTAYDENFITSPNLYIFY